MDHLTIVFLLLLGLGASALVSTSRTDEQTELQNSINCESVCGDCRCRGFYCGEECICECNGDNEDDNKCLTTMRNKCKKLQFPFEVLIQGPSGNRFMRSASLFELYEEALENEATKKRRTIVLYRPEKKRSRRGLEDCDSEEDVKAVVKKAADKVASAFRELVSDRSSRKAVDEAVTSTTETPESEEGTTVDPPIVGLPLALAIPAAQAKAKLQLAKIQAQHAAALASLKASLALKKPLFPALPVQPLFTI